MTCTFVRSRLAYTGTGQQSQDSTCLNLGAGQCLAGGSLAVADAGPSILALGSSSQCAGTIVNVPLTLNTSAADVGGLQVDILYDSTAFAVPKPQDACAVVTPGYLGEVYTSVVASLSTQIDTGRLRVIVADLDENSAVLEDGTVLECQFEVLPRASGSYPFTPEGLVISSQGGKILDSTLGAGQVDVSPACNIVP